LQHKFYTQSIDLNALMERDIRQSKFISWIVLRVQQLSTRK